MARLTKPLLLALLLAAMAGCHKEQAATPAPSAPAAINDPRIPPERRAAIARIIAQQQAAARRR